MSGEVNFPIWLNGNGKANEYWLGCAENSYYEKILLLS